MSSSEESQGSPEESKESQPEGKESGEYGSSAFREVSAKEAQAAASTGRAPATPATSNALPTPPLPKGWYGEKTTVVWRLLMRGVDENDIMTETGGLIRRTRRKGRTRGQRPGFGLGQEI